MVTCDTNLSSESSGTLSCANGTFIYSITPTTNVSSNAIEMWISINGQQVTNTGKWIFNLNEPVTFDNKLKVTVTSLFGTVVKFDVCCVNEEPIPCDNCQSGCLDNDYITKTCDETTGICNESTSPNDIRCLPEPNTRHNCISGICTQDDNGIYSSLVECQTSCGIIQPNNDKYSCSDDCTNPIHATGYNDKLTCLDSCISVTPTECIHTIDIKLHARNQDKYNTSLEFAQDIDDIIRLSDTPIKIQNAISEMIVDISTSIEIRYVENDENKNAIIRICISSSSEISASILPVIAGVAGEAILGIILIIISLVIIFVAIVMYVNFDGDEINTESVEANAGAGIIKNSSDDISGDSDNQDSSNTDSTSAESDTGAPVDVKTTKECGTHDGTSYHCNDPDTKCPTGVTAEHIACDECFSIFEGETTNIIGCKLDIQKTTEDTNKEKEKQDDAKNEIDICKTDNSCTDKKMYEYMIELQGSFASELSTYKEKGIITQIEYNDISSNIASLLICIGDKENATKSKLETCQLNSIYGTNAIKTELDNKFIVFTNSIKEKTLNLIDDMNALLPMYESSELGNVTIVNKIKIEINNLEDAINKYESLSSPTISDAIEFNRISIIGAKAIEYYTNKIAEEENAKNGVTAKDSCEKLTGVPCSTFKTAGLAIGGLIGLKLLSDIFGKK